MGQATRQEQYAKFWRWTGGTPEEENHEAAIDMLLRTLTDWQLKTILAEIEKAGGFPEASDTP